MWVTRLASASFHLSLPEEDDSVAGSCVGNGAREGRRKGVASGGVIQNGREAAQVEKSIYPWLVEMQSNYKYKKEQWWKKLEVRSDRHRKT